ncbi:MAG TPA: hypothetical protein VIH99_03710 [Bdellovibrionota bacterium]
MVRRISLFVGLSLAAFVRYRVLPEVRAHRDTRRMIPDNLGNYDLDGVSYDPASFQVVVSGDSAIKDPSLPAEEAAMVEVVEMNAPDRLRRTRSR